MSRKPRKNGTRHVSNKEELQIRISALETLISRQIRILNVSGGVTLPDDLVKLIGQMHSDDVRVIFNNVTKQYYSEQNQYVTIPFESLIREITLLINLEKELKNILEAEKPEKSQSQYLH